MTKQISGAGGRDLVKRTSVTLGANRHVLSLGCYVAVHICQKLTSHSDV